MANEITLNAGATCTKSGVSISASASASISQSGAQNISNVQIIGATTEAITLGDVATIGYLFVKNLDATNFVTIGLATPVTSGDASIHLLPGEFALIPTRQATWYALADTAPVNLQVVAFEL